ncbi:hypothetical protein Ngar_c32960 [Candidatus Nitrososphaera gargensis Ga9.2]|uniref:Uncharacterized protein n=1 Tax=Nitrososphaera gargensis (strain Ga9.2) TaxID=1237085 RepID=K0IFR7_NITGG|nr:hypothetical protein Ngar_c32960 [Candidatus Nitrososphaera gargensis Ga9.2]
MLVSSQLAATTTIFFSLSEIKCYCVLAFSYINYSIMM